MLHGLDHDFQRPLDRPARLSPGSERVNPCAALRRAVLPVAAAGLPGAARQGVADAPRSHNAEQTTRFIYAGIRVHAMSTKNRRPCASHAPCQPEPSLGQFGAGPVPAIPGAGPCPRQGGARQLAFTAAPISAYLGKRGALAAPPPTRSPRGASCFSFRRRPGRPAPRSVAAMTLRSLLTRASCLRAPPPSWSLAF